MSAEPGNVAFQTYVILRCNRWGVYVRWAARQGVADPRPQRVTSWWGPLILDGNIEQIGPAAVGAVCPVDVAEAQETQRCVYALPLDLKEAMIQEHVLGGTQHQKARAIGVDRVTFWRRCTRAHTALLELMNLAAADLPVE